VNSSIAADAAPRRVIVGVDSHKHVHVAVAIDTFGARLEHRSFAADSAGYRTWSTGPRPRATSRPSGSKARAATERGSPAPSAAAATGLWR
jgi:hypothetical protein